MFSLQVGENENSKYWLGVLNELKNRGVQDVMVICPIFKFSMPTRKIIYTTNAIESLNSCYKKLNRQSIMYEGRMPE